MAGFEPAPQSTDRARMSFWDTEEYPTIVDGPRCDATVIAQLRELADALGRFDRRPRAYLLWESSD